MPYICCFDSSRLSRVITRKSKSTYIGSNYLYPVQLQQMYYFVSVHRQKGLFGFVHRDKATCWAQRYASAAPAAHSGFAGVKQNSLSLPLEYLFMNRRRNVVTEKLSYEFMPYCVLEFKLKLPLCGTRNLNHKLFK